MIGTRASNAPPKAPFRRALSLTPSHVPRPIS
jgi:hypothetical protein